MSQFVEEDSDSVERIYDETVVDLPEKENDNHIPDFKNAHKFPPSGIHSPINSQNYVPNSLEV